MPVGEPAQRPKLIDPFVAKIEELVETSEGRVRADVVHERLVAMGFTGDERTTRRAVAAAKAAYAGRAPARLSAVDHRAGVCGCSSTGAPGRSCSAPMVGRGRRCCSAPGWRGRGSGW